MSDVRKWLGIAAALLLAATVTATAGAAAPSATTGPTTAVGATSATVTGTVNPGGVSTTWTIQYGTTSSYGSSTPSKSAGSGTTAGGVSAVLSGLATGTTYHYRVVASNSSGTSHGGDAVFTTLQPPGVSTNAASGITASAAVLNGAVDPNGRATTFYFEYGTSASYGSKTAAKSAGSAATAQPESIGISGLQPGHTYHFRIVATSDAGTTAGKDASFQTSSAPAVATGGVGSVAPTTARLGGSVTPNGLTTNWWFEYGTSTAYGSHTAVQSAGSGVGAHSVSAGVAKLKPATTYHYRLVAQNSSGKVFGADRTFATVGPPAAQTGPSQSVGPSSATVTGALDTHGRSTRWWFDYGTSSRYGKSTPAKAAATAAGTQSAAAALTGLSPGTTYHYRLVARSDAGTSYGADAAFTTTGVTMTSVSPAVVYGGRVRLSGTVPTLRPNEQVVIYAQPYDGGSFRSVATVLTGVGGAWAYMARPAIGTSYEAAWSGTMSAPIAVGVHPHVALTRLRSGRFLVRVGAGRSFAGRLVQLQRRRGSRWVNVRRVRLGVHSRAEFRATLPNGRSTLRVTLSVNQAGAGFLGAIGPAISVAIKR